MGGHVRVFNQQHVFNRADSERFVQQKRVVKLAIQDLLLFWKNDWRPVFNASDDPIKSLRIDRKRGLIRRIIGLDSAYRTTIYAPLLDGFGLVGSFDH
jgi:hypothetical protein